MVQPRESSSVGNSKNIKGERLLLILKQISKLQILIAISRLYKLTLPWSDIKILIFFSNIIYLLIYILLEHF